MSIKSELYGHAEYPAQKCDAYVLWDNHGQENYLSPTSVVAAVLSLLFSIIIPSSGSLHYHLILTVITISWLLL